MKKFSVMVALLGVLVIFSCSDDGGESTTLKKIVFVSYQSGSYYSDIYTMNEDGSDVVNLTNTPDVNEYYPQWSPDGKKIYFSRFEEPDYYLYVMDVDGSNQTKVTTQRVVGMDYEISPDGTKIAFQSYDGDSEIFVVYSDGTGLANLTNNTAQDSCPSWSPDGQWIVHVINQSGVGKDLRKMKYDGSGYIFITEGPGDVAENFKPRWSPDGTKIAFTRYGNFGSSTDNYELFIIGTDSSNLTNISNNSNNDYYPLWSPDGNTIAFVTQRDGNFNIYLWSGSTTVTRLTDSTAKDNQHSWSPDGTKIVFVSERDTPGRGQIYVMNADGSNQTRLSIDDTMNHQSPKWQP